MSDKGLLLVDHANRLAKRCTWVQGVAPLEVPAKYWPENPGQIRYRASLDRGTAGLALIHELMHVCLHPPGSYECDPEVDLNEESCAH